MPDSEPHHVSAPLRPPAKRPDPMGGAGEEYDVGKEPETPDYEVVEDFRQRDASGRQVEHRELARPRPAPPRWPLVAGVFDFPFSSDARVRWLSLSAGVLPLIFVSVLALKNAATPDYGFFAAGNWISGLLLGIVALSTAMAWSAVMAANFLAILRDTYDGLDRVHNWPSGPFVDWIGESLYVGGALVISLVPPVIVQQALSLLGLPSAGIVLIGVFVLFPIAQLSILETNSPFGLLSPPVWRSLLTSWKTWGSFYVLAAVLVVPVAGLLLTTLIISPVLTALAVPLPLVAVLMIYAKSLGRLAWCCEIDSIAQQQDEDPGEQQ